MLICLPALRLRWGRRFLVSGAVATLLCEVTHGGLSITSVDIDDHPRSVSTAVGTPPLRLSSSMNSLRFHFRQTDAEDKPTARLRYRLEGHDPTWRDLPLEVDMKLSIQFFDASGAIVGTNNFKIIGETPGWTGRLDTSPFISREEQTVAPDRSAALRVLFSSRGVDAALGVIGFDGLQVTVGTPNEPTLHDWTVVEGTELDRPLGVPSNWERQGSRADMATVMKLSDPVRRTLLVIGDADPDRHCIWTTPRKNTMPIEPGQSVRLKWQMAHSIGRCGPGQVEYPELAPGNYWFRVAAAEANGNLIGDEISLPMIVVPPLYQRWEFWLIASAGIGGLAAWITRAVWHRRMNQQIAVLEQRQEIERERIRIARDLHDDIGAGLTAIAMQTDWVRRELPADTPESTRRRAERACQGAIDLTRSVDEIVWAVTPENDTLERFSNYLVHSTEQLLDASEMKLRLEIPEECPKIVLTGKTRHHLFLSSREALTNVLKHSGATTVKLAILICENELQISIEDDGCGFDTHATAPDGTHEGLQNMHQRLAEIGGRCEISQGLEGGTRIEFRLPLRIPSKP